MGFTDSPADTEAKQILEGVDDVKAILAVHADAINSLGANVQWIVDNVQGIFKMFGSPQFMSQMMGVMGSGGFPGGPGPADAGNTGASSGPGELLEEDAAGS